jgi:hypothetical protein
VTATPATAAREICSSLPMVRRAVLFGAKIHVTVPSAAEAIPAIEAALRDRGVVVTEMERIAPTLEDVFIARTAGHA